MAKAKGTKLIAQNKKAYHDYFIEETIQAGISLAGTEVKSLRMGKCSLKDMHSGDQQLLTPEEAVAAIGSAEALSADLLQQKKKLNLWLPNI